MKNNESNEKAKQIWSKTDSKIYKKFVIPVNGMSKEEAEKQLKKLMSNYKEDINFEDYFIPANEINDINIDIKFPLNKYDCKDCYITFNNKEYLLSECSAYEVIYDDNGSIIGHNLIDKNTLTKYFDSDDKIFWIQDFGKNKSKVILFEYQLFFVPYNVDIDFYYNYDIKYNTPIIL
jgi:hypothetical protein